MADVLDTITKFIDSPPGQLVAGAALAGIVWKCFERVETVLNEDTKLEIAVWLLSVKVGDTAASVWRWPQSFSSLLDRVFGDRKLSWRSFWRSCLATYASIAVCVMILSLFSPAVRSELFGSEPRRTSAIVNGIAFFSALLILGIILVVTNCIPDYFSFLKTRLVLEHVGATTSVRRRTALMVSDIAGSLAVALCSYLIIFFLNWCLYNLGPLVTDTPPEYKLRLGSYMVLRIRSVFRVGEIGLLVVLSYPAFFGTIWFLLYAGAGFLLKAARRFDIGFSWFNRHFDIEKHPLQSIGLVAGAIVAVVYWTVVVVHHFVS